MDRGTVGNRVQPRVSRKNTRLPTTVAAANLTTSRVPENRHRLLLHNSFGMLQAEQVFGLSLMNSTGRRVFVREIAARHILEDLGFIPTVAECLAGVVIHPWMAGSRKRVQATDSTRTGDPDDS